MLKKWLIGLFMMSVLLLSVTLTATATTTMRAPGGNVTSYEELAKALGGETATKIEDDHLLLLFDVCLDAPVVIAEGEYILIGAGVEITSSFESGSFFEIGGAEDTVLFFGDADDNADNDNIILNGKGQTREGSLITVGSNATAAIFPGTVLKGNNTTVTGGAVYSEGTFAMYGGAMENCFSTGSGGAIFSKGDLFLAAGTISDCSAEFGGALYNEGEASLIGTEITACSATKGGAVFNAGTLKFVSSSISSCLASQGGGLYNSGESFLEGGQMLTCKSEKGEGGAIYNSGHLAICGTYLSDHEAIFGGTLYNVGEAEMSSGDMYGGIATIDGGNIYNETNAEFHFSGGTIGRGNARYGGGIYNLGNLNISGGGFSNNKATCGSAVLNDGSLSFFGFPYIDKRNDVFVVITDDNTHALMITSEMKADQIAVLTPGIKTEIGYQPYYENGIQLLTGAFVESSYSHFAISPHEEKTWHLLNDGTLAEPIPVYCQPWFYFAFIGSFAVVVTVMVLTIRLWDKKRSCQAK